MTTPSTSNASNSSPAQQAENKLIAPAVKPVDGLLDFDSDEPFKVCPLRNNGDEVCESCQ